MHILQNAKMEGNWKGKEEKWPFSHPIFEEYRIIQHVIHTNASENYVCNSWWNIPSILSMHILKNAEMEDNWKGKEQQKVAFPHPILRQFIIIWHLYNMYATQYYVQLVIIYSIHTKYAQSHCTKSMTRQETCGQSYQKRWRNASRWKTTKETSGPRCILAIFSFAQRGASLPSYGI